MSMTEIGTQMSRCIFDGWSAIRNGRSIPSLSHTLLFLFLNELSSLDLEVHFMFFFFVMKRQHDTNACSIPNPKREKAR